MLVQALSRLDAQGRYLHIVQLCRQAQVLVVSGTADFFLLTLNVPRILSGDFHLLNPFVRITGSGDIDLGARTLNFRVEPKAVLNQQGQGGARDASGLGVPFFVSGPWTKLSYKPDMKALAGTLVQQVTSGQGALGGLLGNVLGGKKSSDTGAAQKKQGFDLNSLFGR